jgi:hypothetical protein
MYVINDVTLCNVNTMLNKNIVECFKDEELVELDYNIIDDMIDKKQKAEKEQKEQKNIFKYKSNIQKKFEADAQKKIYKKKN